MEQNMFQECFNGPVEKKHWLRDLVEYIIFLRLWDVTDIYIHRHIDTYTHTYTWNLFVLYFGAKRRPFPIKTRVIWVPGIHTLHYITLHYIRLHYLTLPNLTLHYIRLHYLTLPYLTLHYIKLHYIHTYQTLCCVCCDTLRPSSDW